MYLLSNLVRASIRRDTQDYVQAISKSYYTASKVFWSFGIMPELIDLLYLTLMLMVL